MNSSISNNNNINSNNNIINNNNNNNANKNYSNLNSLSNSTTNDLPILKQSNLVIESALSEEQITSGSSTNSSMTNSNNMNGNSSNNSQISASEHTGENMASNGAAIDSALRKYGWLHKLSQNGLKLWRKRYFVLTDYILDYYSGKQDKFLKKF